jgi:hypothetical protein
VSDFDNRPVVVTGEERKHVAVRQLARACIALARLRLERNAAEEPETDESAAGQPAEREEGAANG